jgi:hypothetical protein
MDILFAHKLSAAAVSTFGGWRKRTGREQKLLYNLGGNTTVYTTAYN